jgi:hypothetical protein
VSLAVIIVCYHSGDVIHRCVSALDAAVRFASSSLDGRVTLILVANSPLDHIDRVEGRECETVRAHSARNLGFAPAVNLALGSVPESADFVLLLNPDAQLAPNALREMIATAQARNAALVGPVLVDADGRPRGLSERPFHSLRREAALQLLGSGRNRRAFGAAAGKTGRARCLTGACLLADSNFLRSVGGLDATMPMYLEDVALCWCAHQRNLPVILATRARCGHALGGSSGGTDFRSSTGLYLTMLAARVEFVRRQSGQVGAAGMRLLIAAGAVARCLGKRKQARAKHLEALRWALKSGRPPEWTDGPLW